MKRILPIGILLMLSYSLPAFGTSSPRPAGMTVETCTVDGLERTYRLYLPEGRSSSCCTATEAISTSTATA